MATNERGKIQEYREEHADLETLAEIVTAWKEPIVLARTSEDEEVDERRTMRSEKATAKKAALTLKGE